MRFTFAEFIIEYIYMLRCQGNLIMQEYCNQFYLILSWLDFQTWLYHLEYLIKGCDQQELNNPNPP